MKSRDTEINNEQFETMLGEESDVEKIDSKTREEERVIMFVSGRCR